VWAERVSPRLAVQRVIDGRGGRESPVTIRLFGDELSRGRTDRSARGRSFEWSDALVGGSPTRTAGLFGGRLNEWRDQLSALRVTQSGNQVDA